MPGGVAADVLAPRVLGTVGQMEAEGTSLPSVAAMKTDWPRLWGRRKSGRR
ncbi:hypothetical protein ACIA98_39865 [Streptomyces sp. NPDC051366]|uniref:hypothetical protein n=1 Tax=Streptomyces sp. NPDC051366 TaxID=3365652 RepID=UPI00378740C6